MARERIGNSYSLRIFDREKLPGLYETGKAYGVQLREMAREGETYETVSGKSWRMGENETLVEATGENLPEFWHTVDSLTDPEGR
jgi:hypothetical protein